MSAERKHILQWAEQGRIASHAIPAALRLAGVTPTAACWRRYTDRLALWLGVIFLAVGVIFFFAFNWDALGKFAKFGLVQALILGAIVGCYKFRLDSLSGKVALLGATLLMGALLALVGQTYQTGADTFELFSTWALVILPWVVVGRFAALWLVWIGLLNLAVLLYYQALGGLFGVISGTENLLWTLFALNTSALCVWELAARRLAWLSERWPVRILATASGVLVITLAILALYQPENFNAGALLVYVAWLVGVFLLYRYWMIDVYVLAGGALSGIVMVTAILSKYMLKSDSAGASLFIGLVVIGLSAASAFLLKRVTMEDDS